MYNLHYWSPHGIDAKVLDWNGVSTFVGLFYAKVTLIIIAYSYIQYKNLSSQPF